MEEHSLPERSVNGTTRQSDQKEDGFVGERYEEDTYIVIIASFD